MIRKIFIALVAVIASPVAFAQANVPISSLPKDLSPWGMFMHADWVVKTVMIGLVIASIVTWTVWLVKAFEIWQVKRQLVKAIDCCSTANGLVDAGDGVLPPVCCAFHCQAADEVRLSRQLGATGNIKERVESRLVERESGVNLDLNKGVGILATIGNTAPFVGLFGTVWGVMDSFIGISQANTTNLAVVAPGIAEALLATALGLVAAIPAVILYNRLARQISSNRTMLRQFSMQLLRLVSRDLDRLDNNGDPSTEERHDHAAA